MLDVHQVSNKLSFSVDVFSMSAGEKLERCGTIEPNDAISLPNTVTSTPPYMLYFRPIIGGYQIAMNIHQLSCPLS